MYSLPQEIEVWYIIPALRSQLAKILVGKYKIKQKKVAELLGTSEAAISQYLSKKRGKKIKFPKKILKEIENTAEEIVKDNKKVVSQIQRLVSLIKLNGIACNVCKKYNKGILTFCSTNPLLERECIAFKNVKERFNKNL